jgi:hypothetical protein
MALAAQARSIGRGETCPIIWKKPRTSGEGWLPTKRAGSHPCQKPWSTHPVEPPYEVGDLFFFAEHDDKRKISHVGASLTGWNMIHSSRSNNGVYMDNLEGRISLMDIFVRAGSFTRT